MMACVKTAILIELVEDVTKVATKDVEIVGVAAAEVVEVIAVTGILEGYLSTYHP